MRNLLGLFLYFYLLHVASAQDSTANQSKCDYARDPCWIRMMNDPKVNYYEAIRAFDTFWKARGGEPFDKEEAGERNRYNAKKRSRKEKQEEAERQKYLIDYKRFKVWRTEMLPFVQQDGSVLSESERLKLWENQRK